jgi:long-chain acyl-CoA synthetase
METLIDLLRTASGAHADKTALSMRAGLREDAWSYARLWRAAHVVAHFLRREMRLLPGDRVVVWGPNCPQLVAAYFGAMLARLVVVPIDPYATQEFIGRVTDKTEAAAIIAGFASPALTGHRVVHLSDLPFDREGPLFDECPGADEIAEIVFTSGTTGDPKGVILTHRNIVANIQSARNLIPEDARYRLLSILPLSHMLEQTVGLYLPLLYGDTIFYPTGRQSPVILKMLRRHHIVTMVVVPQVISVLLDGIEREVRRQGRTRQWRRAQRLAERLPLRMRRWVFRAVHRRLGGCFEFFICGGAYLPPELAMAWERMGVKVPQGYGTTECAPVIAGNSLQRRMPGSVGSPVAGVQVRLSAESEILVKGANVTQGYWRDEQATRAAFAEDGWYRTGDIAEMDEHGHLYLKGRLKDRIVLPSGLKVYSEDVEEMLRREADVADCVVIGRPDAAGNAHVHAVIIPGCTEADEQTRRRRVGQAVRNANARLAPQQRIGGFTVWEKGDFPRTHLLKVKRHEVMAALDGAVPAPPATAPPPTGKDDRLLRLRSMLAAVGSVGVEAVTPESDLALDLHLDSLSRVELAVQLEAELGVSVADGDLASVGTVAQLLELLDRAEALPPPVSFPVWSLRWPARVARTLLRQMLVFPVHRVICRPFTVEGREHLRDVTLPVLLIANHSSHLDTPSIVRALPAGIRPRLAVAAAADYFYRTRLLGLCMSLVLNTFPFSREGDVRASLESCGELADRGWSILIYPEGTRSPTGKMLPFRSGSGLLATELRVPVVPIAVEGTHAILPKGRRWPRPGPVTVRIGAPLALAPSNDHVCTAALLESAVASILCRDEGYQG